MNAQVLQPDRYEIPLNGNEKFFEIIPAADRGLFLHRRFSAKHSDQLHLIKLDTGFHEKFSGLMPLERDYLIMGRKAFRDRLFLLLRYKDYSRNDFLLYIIDEEGLYIRYTIKGFIPFAPTEFQVTDKAVLIGGYYTRVPVVLHFSLSTFTSRVLPGLFNEPGELTQIRTYPDASFDILISAQNFNKQRTIWIKNYDSEGNLFQNFSLKPEDNKHLIFGRSVKANRDMQLVAGVYGNRLAQFSRGIFIASIDPSGQQQIQYYNFGDLQNFFKYMKAKREKRIKDRIERRKIRGKKVRFNYRFLVHEFIPYNDQYLLLGEAFYPKYSSSGSNFGGFDSRLMSSTGGRVFEGYQYTHAVVMCFDQKGNLVWDNSFEINDVRTFTLEQFVKLEVQDEKIALLYLFENKLRTKIIKNDQVLEGKTMDAIRTRSKNDVIKRNDSPSKLEYWYNDYLCAYGVQEIENPDQGNFRRKVFFINKVKHAK